MQILFITPTYEPGKDGVGDYTHRLIKEVCCQNPQTRCKVISWNDDFALEIHQTDEYLRLPTQLSEREKISLAKAYANTFSPDWISLQWVPYGYHPKGLFFEQISSFAKVTTGKPLQLMVHETWVGAKIESTVKEKVIGYAQRHLFKTIIKRLKPEVVHTQSKAYQHLLANIGIRASLLPLFSNIEPTCPSIEPREDNEIRLGFFGAIHPGTLLERCIPKILKLGKQLSREVHIFQAGRLDQTGRLLFEQWQDKWSDEIQFHSLGEMDTKDVSNYLSSLDIGLSTNPLALLDKSGSIAAMVEHRLPIISLRDDVHFKGFTPEFDKTQVIEPTDIASLRRIIEKNKNISKQTNPSIQQIGGKFFDSLKLVSR